jgi:hypothetical protein
MKKVVSTSETSVNSYGIIRRSNPENSHLQMMKRYVEEEFGRMK